jgi:hypothetical protein
MVLAGRRRPNAPPSARDLYGASLRAPVGRGPFNVEVAFYDSLHDRTGTDPTIPNSQF